MCSCLWCLRVALCVHRDAPPMPHELRTHVHALQSRTKSPCMPNFIFDLLAQNKICRQDSWPGPRSQRLELIQDHHAPFSCTESGGRVHICMATWNSVLIADLSNPPSGLRRPAAAATATSDIWTTSMRPTCCAARCGLQSACRLTFQMT